MTPSPPTSPAPPSTDPGWWEQFLSPDNIASLIIGITVAVLAARLAIAKYVREKENDRRDARAAVYAQALQVVQDYVELPYYVIRREDTGAHNVAVSTRISETQSRLDYLTSWMTIHSPQNIADAYSGLVKTAREEAGKHISEAWRSPARNAAVDMPLGSKLATPAYDQARDALRALMRADLNPGM